MNMVEAKAELMTLADGTYHAIKYELTDNGKGEPSQRCHVYIANKGWHEAAHWEDALSALKSAIAGKPAISEDLPVSQKPASA